MLWLKYNLAFLQPSSRWYLWSFGHSGSELGAPGQECGALPSTCQGLSPLQGWDAAPGGAGYVEQGIITPEQGMTCPFPHTRAWKVSNQQFPPVLHKAWDHYMWYSTGLCRYISTHHSSYCLGLWLSWTNNHWLALGGHIRF